MYFVFIGTFMWLIRNLLTYVGAELPISYQLAYATLMTKVYVCVCVLHLTIVLKFVSSIMSNVAHVLADL